MRDFSVSVEVERDEGEAVSADAVEAILEPLAEHGVGGVTIPADHGEVVTRYGSIFSVEAASAREAVDDALKIWEHALTAAGLPHWPTVRLEAIAADELGSVVPNPPELVGVSEISEMIGASRQRAGKLARSGQFPPPLKELAAGPVWLRSSVESFIGSWERRPGRPRKRDQ